MSENIIYKKKTENGLLQVVDTVYDGEAVCFLKIKDSIQSAMYLDEKKKYDLVSPYMQRFSYAFHVNPDIQKTFLIGGGGFAYPKYYVHTYPSEITVAETSADMISVAFHYFDLQQLPLEEKQRMHIVNEDGMAYLQSHDEKYDLIINDAFFGKKGQARNEACTKIVQEKLHENGIYIVNVSSAISGPFAKKGNAFRKILQKYFKHTVLMAAEEERSPYEVQNLLMISSDKELL